MDEYVRGLHVAVNDVLITPSGEVKVLDFGLPQRVTGRDIEEATPL